MTPPIAVDWDALKQEWRERGTDAIRGKLVELNLISDTSLDFLGDALMGESIWQHALARRGDTSLLAYFVFVWGMSMWEFTSDHNEVRTKVANARNGYLRGYHRATELANADDLKGAARRESLKKYVQEERNLVHLIFDSLTMPVDLARTPIENKPPDEVSGALLLDAMNVESAVYSGSLVATQVRATAISELCDELLAYDLIDTEGCPDGIRGLLREVVGAHRKYYGCVALAADALQRAARDGAEALPVLDVAIERLTKVQRGLGDDVYSSELPAYRVALTAWRDRLRRRTPAVLLDSIAITTLYPFALPDVDGKEAQRIARRRGRSATFSGLPASEPYELQLTDIWTWGGRRRELNSTIGLPMPALAAQLHDEAAAAHNYDVELRFNDLGNHYLRVHLVLSDPSPNDINQALRRATTYSGAQLVESSGQPWDSIADYAKQVIIGVESWIRENREAKSATDETGSESKYEFKPDFDYHVVVSLDGAHVLGSDWKRREAKKEEILRDYGSLLLQMLNRETTTLDEWICWSRPKVIPNLLGEACFPGDFAIGTESTTVLYMPSTPRWARSGYQEVAEFAASFPPLIYQTRTVLDNKLDRADRFTQTDDDNDIDRQEAELNDMRTGLHETLEVIRKIRTYLVPSQLLSLRAEGAFLDQLYQRSRLPELRDDIDGYLEMGRTSIDRMNTHEARLHDHRNRKYQNTVQIILFLVGTFSFSSVAALFLTVWYGSNIPGKDTDPPIDSTWSWHYWDAVWVIAAYLVVVGVGYWYLYKRSKPKTAAAKTTSS
jgi:hypothetical protein